MKKSYGFFVIGLAVVLMVTFVALSRFAVPARPISLVFAGFTNTSQGTEALFWFSNRADPHFTWSATIDVSRWCPTGWVQEPQVADSVHAPSGHSITDWDLLGFPITNTNVPVRFTLNYYERKNLSRRMRISWAEFWENLGNSNKVEYSREDNRWVLGETIVAGGPQVFQ